MVRGPNFHSSRKVEDDTVVMGRPCPPPCRFHSLTDLNSKVWLCLRESLRAILVSELRSELSGTLVGQPTDEFSVLDSQFNGLFLRVPENDLTESRASGVVHMQNRFLAPGHGFNGPPDQIFAGRRQDLDGCGLHR